MSVQAGLSKHFFVLLGAASLVTTATRRRKLLDNAIGVIEVLLLERTGQMCLESWDEAFNKTEDYRGGNANIATNGSLPHRLDVTHDKWLDRALRIASVIIHDVAPKGILR